MKGKNKIDKRKVYFILLCLIVIIIVTSGTYAYFTASKTVNDIINGETATVSFGLFVKRVTDADIIKEGVIPMNDQLAPFASNNLCYDDYENAICQIYDIYTTNTGTSGMYLDGYIVLNMVTDDEMRFIRVYYNGDTFCTNKDCSDVEDYNNFDISKVKSGIPLNEELFNRTEDANALFITDEYLEVGETRHFYAMMWIHNINESQDDLQGVQNAFHGSVTFNSAEGNEITAVFG